MALNMLDQKKHCSASATRSLLRKCLMVSLAISTSVPVFAAGGDAAQQFQQWTRERWATRSISLSELGFTSPAVLNNGTAQREFYLPVPANVPLSDATFQMNARYLRADGGRTTMTVSIDGYPVAARRFNEDQGDASQTIGIDGLPRESGFVRFGVNWSSILSDQVCTDQRAPGNNLRLAADSRFSYRYDRASVKSLATAWSALPVKPALLLAKQGLSTQAYDTAWRTGVALQHAGKQVKVTVVPAVGDSIDLSKLSIPASLLSVPAFAALNDHAAQHRIKDAAEIGALLALGDQGPLRADLVIVDNALVEAMRQALFALEMHIKTSAPEASAAYASWLGNGYTVLEKAASTEQLRLSSFGGNNVIAIPAELGPKAAGLLSTLWQGTATDRTVTVKQAVTPKLEGDTILLSQLGAIAGSIDVLSRAERSLTFDLSAVVVDGRMPSELVFDLSAAPSINGETPIVSIFINDFLLGAKRLVADGRPQRVSVGLPAYTLAARNEVRIVFHRQPTQERCHDQPSAFPVSILPGSHIRLSKTTLQRDFVGIAGYFAGNSELLVSDEAIANPELSLSQVIRIADAVGFSAERAELRVVKAGQTEKPKHPFLALDVALDGYKPTSSLHDGQLIINESGKSVPMLSLAGLDRLASVELVKSSGETGIFYRNIGKQPATPSNTFRLTRGDFAVIGDSGVLLQIDIDDPTGSKLADASNPQSLWEKHMGIWLLFIGAFIFIVISARIAQVRRRSKPTDPS